MGIHIRNGRVLDPANNVDRSADLYINGGRIVGLGEAPAGFVADEVIDATGRWVCPGLIDLQARLREPGQEHKGTIASETAAAATTGITTLCCPPDTTPVIDNASVAEQVIHHAYRAGHARVLPVGALTLGLKGEHLSEMLALKAAGCVAVSNTRRAITNTLVLRRALEYAATLDLTVILNPEDPWLGGNGCMHEGEVSTRLGLPGIPECAEVIAVSRDLILVEQTGVRAHFGQLSSARAIELIAEARQRGLPVSADVSAHQLFLTEHDLLDFDANCHVRPPLRGLRDREGLRTALADGIIDAICSDHQPHDVDAKLAPFSATEPGISALESLLPLTLQLIEEGIIDAPRAIACLTARPAEILQVSAGNLSVGNRADVCIIDPEHSWTLNASTLRSRGHNTPLLGWEMKGRVTHTLLNGHPVFSRDEA